MKRCVFCRFPARIAKFSNVWWSFFIPIQYAIKIAMWDCIWYDVVVFCVSEFQKKMGEFAASIERSKAKSVSASGGLCPPDPLTRGSAPGPRWGLRPQTPVIGSCSARSPCPPLPNPKYANGCCWAIRNPTKSYITIFFTADSVCWISLALRLRVLSKVYPIVVTENWLLAYSIV